MTDAMACVSDADILGLIDGSLAVERRAAIEQHLDQCAECLQVVTLASRTSLAARPDSPELWPPSEEAAGELAPGSSLGRYEIIEPLGRGGMGMVYAARDLELGRRVAIKVVVPDRAASPQSQVALYREAQALARITQPNVLTVYDVGSSGDSVFLAAELVEGETLDAWLSRPRRWRAVVDVFVQAARGLEAVHAAGLVHRDFKPSNVLVGHDERVRVFDFGLVRFTDIEAPGRELAGTPIYMSPEQRRGDLADARSDQYSFCVTLHEALWGPLPSERTGTRTVPTATGHPPGWLREAVRRGLEQDPARRFPSMRALIAVIERGLTRRRRAVRIALAGLAVTAAGLTAALGYLRGRDEPLARCSALAARNPWNAAHRTQLASAFRATGLPYASTTAALVEGSLDRFVMSWRGQRREACLSRDADQAANLELHDRRTACLDQQWIQFQSVFDRFASADRQVVNQVTRLLGAVPDPEACLHPQAATWPDDPDARARYVAHVKEVAEVAALAEAGKIPEAAPRAKALVGAAAALGSRGAEASAAFLAGYVAGLEGRFDEAVVLVESSLWAAEAARDDALAARAAVELIYLISNRQRRPEEARRFIALARAAAERTGSIAAQARATRGIGNLEYRAGQFEAARVELEKALALLGRDKAPDPVLAANLEMDLANVDSQRGHHAEAEARLRRAVAVIARELGEAHPRHAHVLNNLGNNLLDQQRHDEAARIFDRAIAIHEAAVGAENPDSAQMRGNAVGIYIAAGQFDRARAMLEQNVPVFERIDPEHPILGSTLNNLAEVHRLQGDLDGAERIHLRALAINRKRLGEHHPEVTRSLLGLAALAVLRRDVALARDRCEQARRAVSGSDAGNKSVVAIVETCFGEVELLAGNSARAATILERALQMHGTEDPGRMADTQFALARALPPSSRGRAIELARKARASFEREKAYRAGDIAFIDAWLKDPTARWPRVGATER